MPLESPMVILSGEKLKRTFDPSLISGIHETWSNFHQLWQPINKSDLKLNSGYDFFRIITNRVKNWNESHDLVISGARGTGKSAFGLGAAVILNSYFHNDPYAKFSESQICFGIDDWVESCGTLSENEGGGVVILDEVGISGSLSSRESMSKGNRARERNVGWRLDYFLVSENLRENVKSAPIYNEIMGSDHCPVGLELEF